MAQSIDDLLMRRLAESQDSDTRERSFRELVRRHGGALSGFLACYARDAAEREDLVQETLLKVYQARERYTPGGAAFRTWLFCIGRNLALDRRRKDKRRPVTSLEDEAQAGAHSGPGPLGALLGGLQAERVREAIGQLPQADREAVVLRFYEEMAYDAVGRVLGSSAAAAKQRVWRALKKLRTLLGEEHP